MKCEKTKLALHNFGKITMQPSELHWPLFKSEHFHSLPDCISFYPLMHSTSLKTATPFHHFTSDHNNIPLHSFTSLISTERESHLLQPRVRRKKKLWAATCSGSVRELKEERERPCMSSFCTFTSTSCSHFISSNRNTIPAATRKPEPNHRVREPAERRGRKLQYLSREWASSRGNFWTKSSRLQVD